MKRVFFLLGILFFLIPLALATSSTTIFDGWVSYKDSVTSGDTTYSITSSNVHLDDETQGKILLKKDAERYVIPFGDCVSSELYSYCFQNRSFDRQEVTIDDQGVLQPALKISLVESSLTTSISKTKTFSTTSFKVDGTADVTITIENTGDTDITNVLVQETVPDNFEIVTTDGKVSWQGNSFTVNMNLFSGKVWTTTYTIKAKSAKEVTYATDLTYSTVSQSNIKESFGEKTLTFEESHLFSATDLKTVYQRGEKGTLSMTVTNKDAVDITVTRADIVAPNGVQITSKNNLVETTYNSFSKDKVIISPGESKTFSVEATFNVVGSFTFNYDLSLQVRDEEFTYQGQNNASVELTGLNCYIQAPSQVNAATDMLYEVKVSNEGDETFYEIAGTYNVLDKKGGFSLKNINKGAEEELLQGEALIPFSLQEQTYTLKVEAEYRTVDNQYFSCSGEKNITAVPATKLISLEARFKEESAKRNESTPIILTIENLLDSPIKEDITIYFSSSQGRSDSITIPGLIESREFEKEFFIYELLRDNNASVIIKANIPELDNYEDSITISIPVVDPYTGPPTQEEIEQEAIINELKEKEEERQQMNLFEKLKYFFKNFFK
ncbi:MAG: DUF11 domain-containing protein [Nanoarchaeota archaeon]|nr:DUF11 domain-containing protein [Nanoarchaeota archaeon]